MQTPETNPFLGLKPYEPKDRKKLYGRDKDLFLMQDRIFCARTTLLFAGSGVGKTSFINAKIIPELESQYCIIYHNQWSIKEPLTALLSSISTKLPAGGNNATPLSGQDTGNTLLSRLNTFNKRGSDGTSSGLKNRCLIILDQFEEVFQYHADEKYFVDFISQLSEVVNSHDCNVRILFSMREEFLGELSVFDNKVPDLFGNYYRLKCPNRQEAEEIIERTCSLIDTPVDRGRLKTLVRDLTMFDRIEHARETTQTVERPIELDVIAPPYLQIACQRLWNRQFNSRNGDQAAGTVAMQEDAFLSDYAQGDARTMLKSFCREKLNAFSNSEQALLADAFDYLVTKKGAKMAYELSTLAQNMEVDESALKSVLNKLSKPDSRILRRSKGPDQAVWYELYHDMYGPIIDEWRQAYRLEKRAGLRRWLKRAAMVGGLAALVALGAGLFWAYGFFVREPRVFKATLVEAKLEHPDNFKESFKAFTSLRDRWFYENKAKELWADAWKRRALLAERNENTDEAVLSWLTAAKEAPTNRQAEYLAQVKAYENAENYETLVASYQFESDVGTQASVPFFSADGSTLLWVTKDMRVLQWDTKSNKLIRETRLQLDGSPQPAPRAPNPYTTPPPSGQVQPPGASSLAPTILAAATNSAVGKSFVAGTYKGVLYIWDAERGTPLWTSGNDSASVVQQGQTTSRGYGNNDAPYAFAGSSISFAPDGQHFATLNPQGSLQIYRVTAEQGMVPTLASPASLVEQFVFSPTNVTILLFFTNGNVEVRDLKPSSSQPSSSQPRRIGATYVRGVAFSRDGSRFLTLSNKSGKVQIWDTASGSLLGEIPNVSRYSSCSFTADSQMVAISDVVAYSENKKALVTKFASNTGVVVSTRVNIIDDISNIIVSPDDGSILTITAPGTARLWSISPSKPAQRVLSDSSRILMYGISLNGTVVTTLNEKLILSNWSAISGSQIGQAYQRSELGSIQTASRDLDDIYFGGTVIVSPTGKYSGIKDGNGNLVLWDIEQNRVILRDKLAPYNAQLAQSYYSAGGRVITFGPNDQLLAAVSESHDAIKVWSNLGQDLPPQVIPLPTANAVYNPTFSPDGRYLAVVCVNGYEFVRVFEIATLRELAPFNDELAFRTVALGTNGKMVTSVKSDDNAVIVWDLAAGTAPQRLPHSNPVKALALNSNGTHLLTLTNDGALRLWDTNLAKPIGEAVSCAPGLRGVRLSADGRTAIAVSENWIHISSITDQGLEYLDGRPINSGGFSRIADAVRIVDETGKNLRRVFGASSNSLGIEDIRFASPPDNDYKESADALLERWKGKLALTFDDHGHLTPLRGL